MFNKLEEKRTTMENPRTYGKGELASLYAPNIAPSSACKRLTAWMLHHPTLMSDLRQTGYTEKQRTFTPRQVELIFEALGEP